MSSKIFTENMILEEVIEALKEFFSDEYYRDELESPAVIDNEAEFVITFSQIKENRFLVMIETKDRLMFNSIREKEYSVIELVSTLKNVKLRVDENIREKFIIKARENKCIKEIVIKIKDIKFEDHE